MRRLPALIAITLAGSLVGALLLLVIAQNVVPLIVPDGGFAKLDCTDFSMSIVVPVSLGVCLIRWTGD